MPKPNLKKIAAALKRWQDRATFEADITISRAEKDWAHAVRKAGGRFIPKPAPRSR